MGDVGNFRRPGEMVPGRVTSSSFVGGVWLLQAMREQLLPDSRSLSLSRAR